VTLSLTRVRPPARVLAAAAAIGLALRLLFAFVYWTDRPLTRDEREYLSLARGIASGRGFVYDADILSSGPEPFGRAPGYPTFAALVGAGGAITTSVPRALKIAQALAGSIGVVLVGLLASRLAGPRAGAAAALIVAAYPPLVWIAAYAFSEAIAWPLGVAVVLLFDRAGTTRDRHSAAIALAAGAISAVLVLIRPSWLLFVALAAIWLVRRRGLMPAAVFLAAVVCFIAPWTIRNYRHYDRFVLVASEGGVTFWTGNHPRAIGEGDFAANPELKREALALRARHPGLSEDDMEPVYYQEALRWIASHPVQWIALELRKAFYFVVPIGPSYRLHSVRYYAASLVSYAVLLPPALLGFWQLGDRRRRSPGLALLVGSAFVTSVIFFPQERFRIPTVDPALIIYAASLFGRTDSK
jgi:4-amino-4-deoxy-L-arabinose transferase-like glycosyltransferase